MFLGGKEVYGLNNDYTHNNVTRKNVPVVILLIENCLLLRNPAQEFRLVRYR